MWACGISLFHLVLVLKVYRCPSNVSSIKCRVLICCTCYFQSSFPFFVYFGFFCLQDSSVSDFHLDTRGQTVATYLGSLLQSVVRREGHCIQILLVCVGSACRGWTTLDLPQPEATCASPVYTVQSPQCSARALTQVGPAFHALLRSKLSGRVQGHRPGWAVHFEPFPGLRNSGYQILGKRTVPGGLCILFTCPVSEAQFPGCNVRA